MRALDAALIIKMQRRKNMKFVPEDDEQLRTEVRTRYAKAALQVLGTEPSAGAACCGPSCCTPSARDTSPITSDLYSQVEVGTIPATAVLASLGCGNPTALAEMKPGEKVLDLGSGGGIDVLLSAKRVGPTG